MWKIKYLVEGELCHILQENAAYLSRITHLIEAKHIPIYCNENDNRYEYLDNLSFLLIVFGPFD